MTVERDCMLNRPAKVDSRAPAVDTGVAMDLFNPPTPSDSLGEALHQLRMSGAFYCRTELTDPWGLTIPELPDYLWFHIVTAGALELELEHGSPATLGTGDLALVTHGAGHVLRSGRGAPTPGILELERDQVSDRYEILRHGGGGAQTRLMCGAIRFDQTAARTLVAALPDLIRIAGFAGPESERIRETLSIVAAETARPRPGGEAVITRLADVLVIQAIRAWMETDPDAQTGWLGALRDPQIGRALALIHADPGRPWTVASLAREVAMSRSAFAARFTQLVGQPAMHYVVSVRMQAAVNALREEGATVAELASRFGYRSPAAFARAFKRDVGVAPGAIKRSSGDPIADRIDGR
jgi:AraC-like DNA-binding protein